METLITDTAIAVDLPPSQYEGDVPHLLKTVEEIAVGLEGLINDDKSTIDRVWRDFANCVGITGQETNLFFVEDTQGIKDAKAVCETCLARSACLGYAQENMIKVGVWGGTTGIERESMVLQKELSEV